VTEYENAERGLPVGLVYAEGRDMLRDRAVAISRTQMFAPRRVTPLYERFASELARIHPLHLLTTNVDDLIERNLPTLTVVERSDLERCTYLLQVKQSFVCKLHGSVSSIESVVFAHEEYESLIMDTKYVRLLANLTSLAAVVFLGYGLADGHVLQALADNAELKTVFGDGPHFAVVAERPAVLPESCRTITYRPSVHRDHREAIRVLGEILDAAQQHVESPAPTAVVREEGMLSAFFLADFYPPGRSLTGVTLGTVSRTGDTGETIVGCGFTDRELGTQTSTAVHDWSAPILCTRCYES
jgi:hypothetical protein